MCELFTVELANGSTFYYTNHDADLEWDSPSQTYTSIPIAMGDFRWGLNLEIDTVDIQIANISGDFYDKLQKNYLDGVLVTIKRIHWKSSFGTDESITIIPQGNADVEFDRIQATFHVRPPMDTLNIQVPAHTYQEPCNHRLYDPTCLLTQANFLYSGTATGGTVSTLVDTTRGLVYSVAFDVGDEDNPIEVGDALSGGVGAGTGICVNIIYSTATTGTIWYAEQGGVQFVDDEVLTGGGNVVTVNGTPAENTTLYELGRLYVLTGNNAGQKRPVLSDGSNTLTVMWGFAEVMAAGDTYELYPGCDKTTDDCRDKFNNEVNFRGFLYTPRIQETIM